MIAKIGSLRANTTVAASLARRPDGTISALADNYCGKRLNSPNDVVVKSDGSIYFTDPFYGFPADQERELDFQGVYRIAPDGSIDAAYR